MSIADIHAELRRRQKGVQRLIRRRNTLARRLDALDEQIRALGGDAGGSMGGRGGRRGGGGKRPRNEMSLVETLGQVLKGKTMSVIEAAEAVKQAGYKTNSQNFRTQVNIALIKSGKFKRTGRGHYTAR